MIEFEEQDYLKIWKLFDKRFELKPSMRGPFPAIQEPADSVTFHLNPVFDDSDVIDLNDCMATSLAEVCGDREVFYLMDCFHACYKLSFGDLIERRPYVYPDGDYIILVSKDFNFGMFAHPWELSICLFGRNFVERVLARRPKLFNFIIRNNGDYRF